MFHLLSIVSLVSADVRCGSSWADANTKCGTSCPLGIDLGCPSGETCYADLDSCDLISKPTNISNRCGATWVDADKTCGKSCPRGIDAECPNGQFCWADLSLNSCSKEASSSAITVSNETSPTPPVVVTEAPLPAPQPERLPETVQNDVTPGSGYMASIIDESTFNRVLSTCGVQRKGMYQAFVTGFSAPLASKTELALLLGNTAHESGDFMHTKEIACHDSSCGYGKFFGRGYIQLTWKDNYESAAKALKNPEILSNPDIVSDDETVNFSVVSWFWTSSVQPELKKSGYTIGNSVKIINGILECRPNPINSARVRRIQCYLEQLTGTVDAAPYC